MHDGSLKNEKKRIGNPEAHLAGAGDGQVEQVQPLSRSVLLLAVAAQEVHHHVRVVPQAVGKQEHLPMPSVVEDE